MAKEQKVAITAIGQFDGFNVKKNKSVDISFKFSYDERISMMQIVALVSQATTIITKKGTDKPKTLGQFMLQDFKMDRDGECKVKFNSDVETVDMEQITGMLDESGELLKIRMQCEIELEDGDEDGDE